jgi:hypothetical protein
LKAGAAFDSGEQVVVLYNNLGCLNLAITSASTDRDLKLQRIPSGLGLEGCLKTRSLPVLLLITTPNAARSSVALSSQYQQVEYNKRIYQDQRYPRRGPYAADAVDDARLEAIGVALHAEADVGLAGARPADTCEEAVFAEDADCVED